MTTKMTERHRGVQTLTKWVVRRRTVGRAVCAIVAVTSDASHAPIELWTAPRRRQELWDYSRRNLDARPSTDSPTGDSTCAIAISSRKSRCSRLVHARRCRKLSTATCNFMAAPDSSSVHRSSVWPRDVRILTIGGGATEVMLEEVAKRM